MPYKWICTKCGEKASDGLPDHNRKIPKTLKPIDYGGTCPLCQGKLKAYKPKAK